jgi:hypothetical protein
MKEAKSPTYRCTEDGCGFTTNALSRKGVQMATSKHHAETGHQKLVKIRYDEELQELHF